MKMLRSLSLTARHCAPRRATAATAVTRAMSSSPSSATPASDTSLSSTSTTHFGFQQVSEADKKPMVAGVFHRVAERYDVMNDFMSGGMHRLWKDAFIDTLHPVGPLDVLDVAGGTGDIAFRIASRLTTPANAHGAGSHITVCDINSSMLQVGKERATKLLPQAVEQGLFSFAQGDAEQLQFDDNSFDVYTIAFGIRNVTHVDRALAEAYRVLKPGGRFMCLEFSHVPNPLIRAVYDAYSFNVIPLLGEKVASDRDSYQYLVESIRQFPPQDQFKSMMETAGFARANYTNYTHGVVAVHSGFKL